MIRKLLIAVISLTLIAGSFASIAGAAPKKKKVKPDEAAELLIIPLQNLVAKRLEISTARTAGRILFSPDSRILAVVSEGSLMEVFDAVSGSRLFGNSVVSRAVTGVSFSPDSKFMAVSRGDSISLYSLPDGAIINERKGKPEEFIAVAFSFDGQSIATGGMRWKGSAITLWDSTLNVERRRLDGGLDAVDRLAFSIDGTLYASGKEGITAWEPQAGRRLGILSRADGQGREVVFSGKGDLAAITGPDGKTVIKALPDGSIKQEIRQSDAPESASAVLLAFSPDNRALVATDGKGRYAVIDLRSRTGSMTIPTGINVRGSAAFSPDGRTLALAGSERVELYQDFGIFLDLSLHADEHLSAELELERDSKIAELFTPRDEFEKTVEYKERMREAKHQREIIRLEYDRKIRELRANRSQWVTTQKEGLHPFSIELEENRYDADREGFAGKIFGTPVFVSIPREAAKALRDSGSPLLIRGQLRYHDGKGAEVVKAELAGSQGNYPVKAE